MTKTYLPPQARREALADMSDLEARCAEIDTQESWKLCHRIEMARRAGEYERLPEFTAELAALTP